MNSLPRLRSPHGATLIEALVAIVVLSMFLVGLVPMIVGTAMVRRQSEGVGEASALAQTQLEEVRRYWSVLNEITNFYKFPVNYDDHRFPLFGQTDANCTPKNVILPSGTYEVRNADRNGIKTVYNEVTTGSRFSDNPSDPNVVGLNDIYTVSPTDARVYSYGLLENPITQTSANGQCNYLDFDADANDDREVRFVAQMYYGPAPGSQRADVNTRGTFTPTSDDRAANGEFVYNSYRVVVRIYAAREGNGNACRGEIVQVQIANCLFTTTETATKRTVSSGNATLMDRSAPLVVQYTDI
ncbi:hypothetical protein, partial [Candidatus Cyanaurora vandensis]|uniref:type IV pilus modification PilV family protein n=1 Tax=Candidatus Cyanaurora vandensis TaxID=2714958 RepID=UPI00257C86D9